MSNMQLAIDQQRRIEALTAEVEKWHRVAMEAGAITCVGGGHIYPLRERIEQLEERMRGADALIVLWETRATRAEALVKQLQYVQQIAADDRYSNEAVGIAFRAALAPEQDKQ